MATPYVVTLFEKQHYCMEASETSGEETENKTLEEIDIDEYTLQNQKELFQYPEEEKLSSKMILAKRSEVISLFSPPPEI